MRSSHSAPPYTDAERYLERYAEPEARLVAQAVSQGHLRAEPVWGRALVVPVLGEQVTCLQGFAKALSAAPARSLVVLVVNANEGTSAELQRANETLVGELAANFAVVTELASKPRITLRRMPDADLLVIERWEQGARLDARQGVGLARKLGSDVALTLWMKGLLRSPRLYQTDADATLPDDVFTREVQDDSARTAAGGVRSFPFRHVANKGVAPEVLLATLQYEVWLRYHVLGLRWAESPYAHHALGSCITVHASSYVAVRGFPKRAAGEDFYLLQKVNKLAPVALWSGAPVRLAARTSQRAPFGTGPRVHALLNGDVLGLESGVSYALLRQWLRRVAEFASARDGSVFDRPWVEHPASIAEAAEQALRQLGARERLQTLLTETSTSADLLARAHTWFDGLKTQRFLHALRAQCPEQPAVEALRKAPFTREWAPTLLDEPSGSIASEIERWRRLSETLAERGAE